MHKLEKLIRDFVIFSQQPLIEPIMRRHETYHLWYFVSNWKSWVCQCALCSFNSFLFEVPQISSYLSEKLYCLHFVGLCRILFRERHRRKKKVCHLIFSLLGNFANPPVRCDFIFLLHLCSELRLAWLAWKMNKLL